MSYEGFLSFGGAEIMNAGRTSTYVNNLLPQFGLENCAECDDLRHALGHEPYTSPFVDQPDWFDENNPDSWRFYGLYPVEINGLDDSVRESSVTQLAVDGAVMSAPRQQGREIRVSALLIGADDAAVQYGITWLRYATFGAACREGEGCTGDHLCYFAACPPICEDSPDVTHGEVGPRIHNFRTCDEGIITNYERACALPYERNLYQVTVIDGPRIVEQYNPVCGAMVRVEWTMVAGVPWAYSTATFVDESATGDPSTIIPEISCAAGSTSVVRRNLATNPIPAGTPGTAGWASADPARWSVAQDTDVIRLPGDASARMEVLDNTAQPNLATNPGPTANLTGWTYHLGDGPNDQSRTNLFPNPRVASLTGVSSTTGTALPADATNYWSANPGLQVDQDYWDTAYNGAPAGEAAIATNLLVDPRATSGNTWSQTLRWFGSGGAGTRSLVTSLDPAQSPPGTNITTASRKAWTTSPTGSNADTGFQITASTTVQRFPVVEGNTYYLGGFLRHNAATTRTGVARIIFYDAAGDAVGGSTVPATGGTQVTFTVNDGWVWIEHTRTAPATATEAMLVLDITTAAGDVVWLPGDRLEGTGAIFVDQGTAGTWSGYLDGSLQGTGSFAYAWSGVTNNSTSSAFRNAIAGVELQPPGTPGGSTVSTSYGSGFLTKTFTEATSAFSGNMSGNLALVGPIPVAGLPTNLAFSFAVWGPTGHSARLQVQYLNADGMVLSTTSGTAVTLTAAAGYNRATASRSTALPTGTTHIMVSLSVGATSGGVIAADTTFRFTEAWVSTAGVSVNAQWFDGSSPDRAGALDFAWTGTPRESTSTRTKLADPSATLSLETGLGPDGVAGFVRRTVVVPAISGVGTFSVSLPGDGQITSGTAYAGAVSLRSSVDQTVTLNVLAGDTVALWQPAAQAVDLPAGQWVRVPFAATATGSTGGTPTTFTVALSVPNTLVTAAGTTLDIAQIVVQPGEAAGPFFDGAFPDTPGRDFAWTGAANASTSTLTVTQPSVTSTLQTGGGGPVGQTTFMRNVIVVPKTDGFSGPSYTQAVTVPAGGMLFTTSIWVRSTVGGAAPLRVQALDVNGAVLASVVSAPVTVVADTWTEFGPVTINAPFGTTQIRIWPQTDGTQILPAGTAIDVGHVTLVQGWSLYSTIMAHLVFAGQHTLTRVIALMPEVVYTASIYVATSRPAYARVDVTFYNSSGGIIGRVAGPSEHVAGQFQPTPARMWTRIEHTFTAPVGTATATFEVLVTRDPDGYAEVGDRTWFTNMLIERSSVAQAYFDGSFADTATLNYGWTGTANASISTVAQIIPATVGPLLDPDCAAVPLPPRPPALEIACLDTPTAWRRYTALIPDDVVPVWRDAVPIVDIQTQATAARQVRVRFYPNPFAGPPETLDPCDFCGEFVISYIPPNSVLTIDGIRQQAFVTGPTGTVQVANHLLYASDGGPMQWPLLSCGVTYTAVVDVAPEGVADLSAKLCIAARE